MTEGWIISCFAVDRICRHFRSGKLFRAGLLRMSARLGACSRPAGARGTVSPSRSGSWFDRGFRVRGLGPARNALLRDRCIGRNHYEKDSE